MAGLAQASDGLCGTGDRSAPPPDHAVEIESNRWEGRVCAGGRGHADASIAPRRDGPEDWHGHDMQIGVMSFGDAGPDVANNGGPAGAMQNLLELITLADEVGLDVFGVGEHHRPDFPVSVPAVVLAAAAARTSQIRLTSSVTVLGSDDPVRVFQQFATVDQISNGRAEIIAGRGSFIESFPLFGYALDDYEALFEEKLELLLTLRENERVTWSGRMSAPLEDRGVYPRPVQSRIPISIAVGGTPESVARAGRLGLPLVLAIIGGSPHRFAPLAELYRSVGEQAGHDPAGLSMGLSAIGFVGDSQEEAIATFSPPYARVMTQLGRERGWGPVSAAQVEHSMGPSSALIVGDAPEVTEKLLALNEMFGLDRFILQPDIGGLPHDRVMRAIELLGTEVAPAVRAAGPVSPAG